MNINRITEKFNSKRPDDLQLRNENGTIYLKHTLKMDNPIVIYHNNYDIRVPILSELNDKFEWFKDLKYDYIYITKLTDAQNLFNDLIAVSIYNKRDKFEKHRFENPSLFI